MPSRQSKPRRWELRLSLEASKRIDKRIDNFEITILKNLSRKETKLGRLGIIQNRALEILEENGESPEGCTGDSVVKSWLKRKNGKSLSVFNALCEVVDENWEEVYDRTHFKELIESNIKIFMNSFLEVFISSSDERSLVLSKYLKLAEQMIVSDKIGPETITVLIDTFHKEFALNGRQIRFRASVSSTPCYITSVEITGINQKNKLETWRTSYAEPYQYVVETEDWWWKGNVEIRFQAHDGKQKFDKLCKVSIPPRGYIWTDISFDLNSGSCVVK